MISKGPVNELFYVSLSVMSEFAKDHYYIILRIVYPIKCIESLPSAEKPWEPEEVDEAYEAC